MKKLLTLLLLLPVCGFAQKVKVDNDTVYKDDKPYCVILKQGAALDPVYSIRTLSGKEVATMVSDPAVGTNPQGVGYDRINFTGSGAIAHFPNGLPLVKRVAKALVESDVLSDTAVNPAGEKRFVGLYPSKSGAQSTTIIINNNTGPDYTTVQRNKFGPVMANGGTLSQSGVNIGTYSSSSNFSGNKYVQTTTFSLINGVQCAVATYDQNGAKSASVRTMKDNSTRTITIKNPAMCEQEIADWLSQNGYL